MSVTVAAERVAMSSEESQTALLTVVLLPEGPVWIAKCPELDLVTEMDAQDQALQAMLELIREYAEDYRQRAELFDRSPNRAHHKPYVERVSQCSSEEQLRERLSIHYGRVHLQPVP